MLFIVGRIWIYKKLGKCKSLVKSLLIDTTYYSSNPKLEYWENIINEI